MGFAATGSCIFLISLKLATCQLNLPELMAAVPSARVLQASSDTTNSTQVSPFNCSKHSGLLQTFWGKDGFFVTERTLKGTTTLFSIPFNRTNPSYKRINACGINPIDNILYCIMEVMDVPYLTRIDASRVEFVAKLPTWSWAAAFGNDGTFYFHEKGKYYKVEGASLMVGFADPLASELEDQAGLPSFIDTWAGADLVAVMLDFEGIGENEYLMTLADNGRLRVTRVTGTPTTWLLQSKPELPKTGESYGAAWNYQSRVFFSSNAGSGIFEVIIDSIDLLAGTVVVERAGPAFLKDSLDKGATDGMNCMNVELPSKWSGLCGSTKGSYSAITGDEPAPPPGAKNVRPSQELMFLPSDDSDVVGYQVFLGAATLNADDSVASAEWHLACNLPCGVNVCKPPFGLDNSLGGHFAWRVDMLKLDGSIVTGPVWHFSLMATVMYDTRAVADTYIDKKKNKNYADKRHMLMRSRNSSNPQFGFIKFNLSAPLYTGRGDCEDDVVKALLRLTVLSVPMKDVSVYRIPSGEDDFDEFDLTSAEGKHPGGAYPFVFNNSDLVSKVYGPVEPKKDFTIDVTLAVQDAFKSGRIAFGLETSEPVSRFCAQSRNNTRKEGWCYPKLEIVLGAGSCPVKIQDPSCSKPVGSPPGPLDATCGTTPPTFPTTDITDWREGTAITTTTTTTTTTQMEVIKEGHCRYNDHVQCPWPHSDTMCSGDQCCPDGSTCPSSQFAQAQGCNLKKYDCTSFVPANWTCRESEEVFCPGTSITCSGNTCCPNNTTCPSASVMQAESCGPKSQDCQAVLSSGETCAIGEFVKCPGSDDKCHGNQCCPDGSTCPSAPLAVAPGCGPKKATCELLEWDVKLRVTNITFAKIDPATKDDVSTLAEKYLSHVGGVEVETSLAAGSLIVNAKIGAPGGWSQQKLDQMVTSSIISEETRMGFIDMLAEVDGLQEASSGDMVFEPIKAKRADSEADSETSSTLSTQSRHTSTPSPVQSDSASTSFPPGPGATSTSLRGAEFLEVPSSSSSASTFLTFVISVVSTWLA
eukprot:gnl/MRDRNA2_/MRDRNA2_29279_c0_seq3.p1 gnl/MRDRNA2_/MRDRNA2_29279_c0~~gnl/MRDRNA2_/MRDRNA2_29279_c0_seq3.p1  ORF type:complete len:1069 (-),score=202.51 gnl/MRDRNA2_/MRDRNA2_29279_c0_seq3:213-3323(-)